MAEFFLTTWQRFQLQRRNDVFEKLIATYNKCLDGDIFVGLGDELYSVYTANGRQRSDNVGLRYVSKQGKGLYEDLVMEKNRQNCLTDLGLGMGTCDVPSSLKQNIYQKMRPMTETTADFGTQTDVPLSYDDYNTIKMNLKTKKYQVSLDDGMVIKLTAEEAIALHGFLMRCVQLNTSEYDDLIASQSDCSVETQEVGEHQLSPKSDSSSDSQMLQGATGGAIYHQPSPKSDSSSDSQMLQGATGGAIYYQPSPKSDSSGDSQMLQGATGGAIYYQPSPKSDSSRDSQMLQGATGGAIYYQPSPKSDSSRDSQMLQGATGGAIYYQPSPKSDSSRDSQMLQGATAGVIYYQPSPKSDSSGDSQMLQGATAGVIYYQPSPKSDSSRDSQMLQGATGGVIYYQPSPKSDSSRDSQMLQGATGGAIYYQPSPKSDSSGDSQMLQGATAGAIPKTTRNMIEMTKRMSQGYSMKFHKDVPYEGQLERYLSPYSPFPLYGYKPSRDVPATLDDIKIPVVESHHVTYRQTESDGVILGRGGFGCVYFAKHCNIAMDLCVKEFENDCTSLYDIHQEAKLMLYLQSTKFVPQCFGLMVSPFVSAAVSLVQECFAKGYTLKHLLNDRLLRSFTDRRWVATVYQLFWGLKVIHEKQVLLNDIKTDNVLIDYQCVDMSNSVRFIDMGLATFRRGHRFSDDPTYMEHCENHAPEVRLGTFSSPASDLYAVGYMVNEISETIGIVELDLVAQMCTEDDPDDRSSCRAVLKKLEDILEEM